MPLNLVFTALPWKDAKTGKLMVSAYVSIQADVPSDTTLADFNDIINWVDKVSKARFIIQWGTKQTSAKLITDKLDKTLYQQLFIPKIKVRSFQPEDLTVYPIRSYPVKHVLDFIQKAYIAVGNTKSDVLPTEKFFTDEWKDLLAISEYKVRDLPEQPDRSKLNEGGLITPDLTYRNRLKSLLKNAKVVPFDKNPQPSFDFAQLRNFHDATSLNIQGKPATIPPPNFEYHDILSVLTSYPQLMRKFGLVLDLEVESDHKGIAVPIASLMTTTGTIRVIPQDMDFEKPTKISSPATAYIKTTNGFYTQSKTESIIEKGVLKLNNGDFTVVQIDADGAALKLCNQIDNLQQLKAKHLFYIADAGLPGGSKNQEKYENYSQRDEGLPVIRSSGIGIARNGLAALLMNKFQRSNTLTDTLIKLPASSPAFKGINATFVLPAESDALYADDVVQGFRMDIAYEDKPTQWYSLHQRQDEYKFKPISGTEIIATNIEPDEGFIQVAMSQQTSSEKQLTVGEVLARWEGWSLSVLKPGKSLNNPGAGEKEISDNTKENEKYTLPGYIDFRLQAKSSIIKTKGTLPLLRFGKNYRIKIRTVDLAGNSIPFSSSPENEAVAVMKNIQYRRYESLPTPVLVLGNDCRDGESIEHMVIRSNFDTATTTYEQNNPVKIDGVTQKYPPTATRHIKAPKAAQQFAETHGQFDAAFGAGNAVEAKKMYDYITDPKRDKETVNPTDYTDKINYVVDGETKKVELEYLADPMAAGALFVISRKSEDIGDWKKGDVQPFSFYFDEAVTDTNINKPFSVSEWMFPKSLRIRLEEDTTARVRWDSGERKFIVYLPKGHNVTLHYASFWRPDDIKRVSGMNDLLFNSAAANSTARGHAMKGQHWMFSPWREIRLTHAVQQPLLEPSMKTIEASRKYDDTIAELSSLIRVSGISTDKINLEARWDEYKDDLAELGPDIVKAAAHVAALPVQYDDATLVNGDPLIDGNPYQFSNQPSEHAEDIIVQQFGDTKHRNVEYQPIATTRYREYFTRLINEAKDLNKNFTITRNGNKIKVNILSTARPVAPQVEYVLPSFNWAKNASQKTITHLRTGNTRVYMKRPWFSSGEGEQIAVVLAKGKDFTPELAKYCTIWGKDPLFFSGELNSSNFPTPDQPTFPFASHYEVNLTINETTGIRVAAASYNVLYDQERQLYYADIPIAINQAYFPFVKLALARYQFDSLRLNERECCLSNIVHTDWIQIVPPRATIVTFPDQANKNKLTVGLGGTSPFVGISNPMLAMKDEIRTRIRIIAEDASIPKNEEAFVRMHGDRFNNSVVWQKDFNLTSADMDLPNHQIKFLTSVELKDEYRTKPYRLVIEEYELHLTDPLRQPQDSNDTFASKPEKWQERLVFMDVFEINGSV